MKTKFNAVKIIWNIKSIWLKQLKKEIFLSRQKDATATIVSFVS